jgi:hypothetical protein
VSPWRAPQSQATEGLSLILYFAVLRCTQASASSAKAQFDKFVLDKSEEKAAFDAVLETTTAEAAAQKAVADKALVDFGELQVGEALPGAVAAVASGTQTAGVG